MDDGGERGARNANSGRSRPRARGNAAGPPKFINRHPLAPASRTPSRSASTNLEWIPLTRVRPLGGALSIAALGSRFLGGGRPFAPRVSIDRAHLPGAVQLRLGFDVEARLERAAQIAFSIPTQRRHNHWHTTEGADAFGSIGVGGGFPNVAFALWFGSCTSSSQRGDWMRTPAIKSLDRVSLDEALAYLDASNGDELGAAFALATHRNELGGSAEAPDDAEVHHALFLLRRARGLDAPSFDLMRVQLKRRVAA
jgi:hypothetical protein